MEKSATFYNIKGSITFHYFRKQCDCHIMFSLEMVCFSTSSFGTWIWVAALSSSVCWTGQDCTEKRSCGCGHAWRVMEGVLINMWKTRCKPQGNLSFALLWACPMLSPSHWDNHRSNSMKPEMRLKVISTCSLSVDDETMVTWCTRGGSISLWR